jgi:hypothetical protein
MYSLPNPSESERPFSPLEEPVLRALSVVARSLQTFTAGFTSGPHYVKNLIGTRNFFNPFIFIKKNRRDILLTVFTDLKHMN